MTPVPDPPCGAFAGPVHRCALRVYFEDTDAGGIVYHANYLRWYERARSDMLRLLGIGQREAMAQGIGTYVIAHLDMRFFGPARLDDIVIVESRVERVQPASVRMHQVASVDGVVVNEARLKVGFIDPAGRPRRQPGEWLEAFSAVVAEQGQDKA